MTSLAGITSLTSRSNLAHRLERMSAKPSEKGPITELAQMVDPGPFKKLLEGYKKVWGASDVLG